MALVNKRGGHETWVGKVGYSVRAVSLLAFHMEINEKRDFTFFPVESQEFHSTYGDLITGSASSASGFSATPF